MRRSPLSFMAQGPSIPLVRKSGAPIQVPVTTTLWRPPIQGHAITSTPAGFVEEMESQVVLSKKLATIRHLRLVMTGVVNTSVAPHWAARILERAITTPTRFTKTGLAPTPTRWGTVAAHAKRMPTTTACATTTK